jgi:hypothetical protein
MGIRHMEEQRKYTSDDIVVVKIDESIFDAVDLTRSKFRENLVAVAQESRDFARSLVFNRLPDAIAFTIYYGCSYDGNALVGDEKTFPEDYAGGPVTTNSPEAVTSMLWRNGFVPEWINVTVSHEDGFTTFISLHCCGRYSATPRLMYHVQQGRSPFQVVGPPMPPDRIHGRSGKYDLYWSKDS